MAGGCNWMRECLKAVSLWPDTRFAHQAREVPWASALVSGSVALFMTTLPSEGFLVEEVLDLYQGRGAEDRGAG
jgi:hypothetical protein